MCRTNFSADLTQQLDTPLQFVDFLREPEVDANTGETTNEHPSYYESVQGGLPDIKCASCCFSMPDSNSELHAACPASCVIKGIKALAILWGMAVHLTPLQPNHTPAAAAQCSSCPAVK